MNGASEPGGRRSPIAGEEARAESNPPASRWIASVLVAAALAALGIIAVHRQLRDGNDFPLYWQAARDVLAGRSPYDVGSGLHGYVYLPWFAIVLVPLALLPLPTAAACWYVVNVAFAWFASRFALASLRDAGLAPGRWTLVAATVPLVGLVGDNLVLGQANLLLLWLVALGVRCTVRSTPGRAHDDALGLAAALKMPAAVLALPLLLRARVRRVAGFALAVVLAVGAPLLIGGPSHGVALLRDWHAKVVAPAAAGTLQGSKIIDQSPQAALRRLLVAEPAFDGRAVNVAALDPPAFNRVSRGVSVVVLVAYLLVWALAPAPATPRALLLDLALGCCAMVQLTGFSLKAQFVVLLLPAWVAASLAFARPAPGRRAALIAAGALFLLSQPGLVGRAASNLLLAYSSMTLATLLLAATLAAQRFDLTPPPSAARAAAPAPGTAP